ncbi:M48 family metallopeptidase [Geomonas limicola]|uniref:M48 family metallopeptidase n=1 Tax=Geomonas limicola TaxID=2740186 RepID=UPI00161D800F|nr:M48 family metallopeptidase [Geomonas limicola]
MHQDERLHPDCLRYLAGYSEKVLDQVRELVAQGRLGEVLSRRYPAAHVIRTDRALYDFTLGLKNQYLRSSSPLGKVLYDTRITAERQALGLHSYQGLVQGARIRTRNEIRIASLFKSAPLEFLRMIVVHELAHLKEREHNKAFYQLCEHMEPDYYQLEFDVRLYLTLLEQGETLYGPAGPETTPASG